MPTAYATRRLFFHRPVKTAAVGGDPSTWAARQIWLEADAANVKANDDGTGTVSDGGTVGYIAGLGGTPNFVNATAGQRPTWVASRNSLAGGSGLRLACASVVTCPGTFTLYAVGMRQNNQIWMPVSDAAADQATVQLYSDNVVYLTRSGGSAYREKAYTGTSDAVILMRVRRDSAGVWKVAATGMAEASATTGGNPDPLTGTFSVQHTLGRPFEGSWTSAGNEIACVLLGNEDAVASGADPGLRSYLVSKYSVTDIP